MFKSFTRDCHVASDINIESYYGIENWLDALKENRSEISTILLSDY